MLRHLYITVAAFGAVRGGPADAQVSLLLCQCQSLLEVLDQHPAPPQVERLFREISSLLKPRLLPLGQFAFDLSAAPLDQSQCGQVTNFLAGPGPMTGD